MSKSQLALTSLLGLLNQVQPLLDGLLALIRLHRAIGVCIDHICRPLLDFRHFAVPLLLCSISLINCLPGIWPNGSNRMCFNSTHIQSRTYTTSAIARHFPNRRMECPGTMLVKDSRHLYDPPLAASFLHRSIIGPTITGMSPSLLHAAQDLIINNLKELWKYRCWTFPPGFFRNDLLPRLLTYRRDEVRPIFK
jgi:hypothetical protein